MRVLAVGGAGGMGRHACRAAIGLDGVDELVITDLDGTRAARFAAQLGPGVRSLGLDVTDGAALDAALAQADVVMNTAGPFFRFGVPVLAAALGAGCHYLDICDDWEPTLQMLDLHEQAARRGLTAIVGTVS
jgi:saccharopine dehydrogenase-like NADP-dependent oxidoreductase